MYIKKKVLLQKKKDLFNYEKKKVLFGSKIKRRLKEKRRKKEGNVPTLRKD